MGIPYGGPQWSWPMRIIFFLTCLATVVTFFIAMSRLDGSS